MPPVDAQTTSATCLAVCCACTFAQYSGSPPYETCVPLLPVSCANLASVFSMISPSMPPRVATWNSWPGLPPAGAAAAGAVVAAGALVGAGALVAAGAAVGDAAPPHAASAAAPARPPASVSRRRRDITVVGTVLSPSSLDRTDRAPVGTAPRSGGAPPRIAPQGRDEDDTLCRSGRAPRRPRRGRRTRPP